MCRSKVSMGFTHETFPKGTHMCLIYNSETERKKVISRFLDAGMQGSEKVAYFADRSSAVEIAAWLKEEGIDLHAEKGRGEFTVSSTADTYHPGGRFDPDDMLDTLKNFQRSSESEGFPACRVSGEMSWAAKEIPGSERLMEYEAKVNIVVEDFPVTAICQYDANKFDGVTLLDCLKVHPYMIVKGRIVRNPYYMRPEDFLDKRSN